jgi:hypothetical protein
MMINVCFAFVSGGKSCFFFNTNLFVFIVCVIVANVIIDTEQRDTVRTAAQIEAERQQQKQVGVQTIMLVLHKFC